KMKSFALGVGLVSFLFAVQSEGTCDTYWTEYNGKCYRYFGEPYVNWVDAENNCIGVDSHLAAIHSAEDQEFIVTFWRTSRGAIKTDDYPWKPDVAIVYIGLRDVNGDGDYAWSDGTALDYTNWSTDQPSGGSENSVIIWDWPKKEGKWNDITSKTKVIIGPYICQKANTEC
ncbi:lectin-like protein, partial [Salmonella sp. s55004]|uniref:lectin-like protein n=1 Tax=Salmonella sp. s55004 TaxID=3159675 RepID=UPI00398092A3